MLAGWEDDHRRRAGRRPRRHRQCPLAYWQQRHWELGDSARKLTVKASAKVPQGQVDMFESESA
jgi:hypothetical protein